MTIDEAIKILDPKTSAETLAEIAARGELSENRTLVAVCEDACLIAVEALKRSRWIPCSERLPGLPIDVLAVVSGTVGNIRLVNSLEIGSFHVEEGWILEMWPEWENPTVTHWQPLPELPDEGGPADG